MHLLLAALFILTLVFLVLWLRAREKTLILEKDLEVALQRSNDIKILENTFRAHSLDALEKVSGSLLEIASLKFEKFHERSKVELEVRQKSFDHLIKPIQTSLEQVDKKIALLDRDHHALQRQLLEQVRTVGETCTGLKDETSLLIKALRKPDVRGRWGEMQLKRAAELAGMIDHCDFHLQVAGSKDSEKWRPDMVVRLPGGKTIVVDAKTPLYAYLEAIEEKDEKRRLELLKEHAKQVRTQIQELSSKRYFEKFDDSPEFVVLFLPGESFYSVALEHDPSLIEVGAEARVILATPTTLIALLRTVEVGWRHESIRENAKIVFDLSSELAARLSTLNDHFETIRKGLDAAVEGYNKATASYESRVMVTARKFKDYEVGEKLVNDEIKPLDKVAKILLTKEPELIQK